MISGCFPGWGLYLQRLSTGDTDTVSKSSVMLVKKPGGRDMKKYIWLRIILGSMKNTDLFIWETGRIRAVRTAGFILSRSPDSCTPFIQRSLMQSAPKALACYLPVPSEEMPLYAKGSPAGCLLLSVRNPEIPISRILFSSFLSLPQFRHRPFSSPHSGCRRKLRRIF